MKRDQVCVKWSCEARDGGRWTRGFRRGGLTRGRGPGYTCHTIRCKRNYNSKENHSLLSWLWRSLFLAHVLASSFLDSFPIRLWPKHCFQNASKTFWHHGSPFHLQAALLPIRTFFQVQFLCRLLPIFLHQRLARQTSGSKSITVPQNPNQSENSPKPFLSRQVTIFLFFQGPLLPTQLPFHLIYFGSLLKLTTKSTK